MHTLVAMLSSRTLNCTKSWYKNQPESTRRRRHTRPNLRAWPSLICPRQCGTIGPLPGASILRGSCCQIVFGRPTGSKSVGGPIAGFTNYARGNPSLRDTSSSSVVTPWGLGSLYSLGLGSSRSTPPLDLTLRRSKIGGFASCSSMAIDGSISCRSSCLPLGRFGMISMRGYFVMFPPCRWLLCS
jgi:hypothetical protein